VAVVVVVVVVLVAAEAVEAAEAVASEGEDTGRIREAAALKKVDLVHARPR
jgi:hypothetical protein